MQSGSMASFAAAGAMPDIDPDDDMQDVSAVLLQQIEHVKVLREDLESRTQDLHEKQIAFNQENAALIEEKCRLADACSEAEKKLRELTLAAYQATGSKKPAPGVGIRIVKSIEYDPAEARKWAASKGACLTLDTKAFEAVVLKSVFDDAPGKVVEHPQATIAKEL